MHFAVAQEVGKPIEDEGYRLKVEFPIEVSSAKAKRAKHQYDNCRSLCGLVCLLPFIFKG